MRGLFRIRVIWMVGTTGRKIHFGVGIILGTMFVGSRFSKSLFRDVLRTVPESVRTRGFKRNSSNLDRAPKMLNSWDSILVTLLSTFSETCVMYSSVIPGTDVFRDWLFLRCSCVSLETAANFRLFLNVAISWGGKCSRVEKTELFCISQSTLKNSKKLCFEKNS